MTQPAPPSPPEQDNSGAVVASAAIGLALVAVEARVRQEVEDDIELAMASLLLVVLSALAAIPAGIATGVGFMSWTYVYASLTRTITKTRGKVAATIQAGYTAAAQLALQHARADLAELGYTVPAEMPELGGAADHLVGDVDTMFGHAQAELQSGIAAGFDSATDLTGRRQAISESMQAIVDRLHQRAQAAAGTAVHQGASDAQQAIYAEYANHTGDILGKRWTVTSATPCGMCEPLDGTIVGLHSEFDRIATTDDKDLRPVWRNLFGPPRHPNCRCQVELVVLG